MSSRCPVFDLPHHYNLLDKKDYKHPHSRHINELIETSTCSNKVSVASTLYSLIHPVMDVTSLKPQNAETLKPLDLSPRLISRLPGARPSPPSEPPRQEGLQAAQQPAHQRADQSALGRARGHVSAVLVPGQPRPSDVHASEMVAEENQDAGEPQFKGERGRRFGE